MFEDYMLGISPWIAFGFFHLVMAVALWKMADRVKEEQAWFAIVPLLNIILLLKLARKPLWWIVLFFLPIANIVAMVMASMSLCERFGIEKWWGFVSIVSPINLVLFLYLAFAGTPADEKPATAPVIPPVAPKA